MSSSAFVKQLSGDFNNLEKRLSIWEKLNLDLPLLFAIVVLTGFGLMVLYSATDANQADMRRQIIFIVLAFIVMFIVAQVDVRVMRRWAPLMYVISLSLLVVVLFFGSTANGAQRWLDLPGLPRFQPSEIMKIVLPLTLAAYFSRRSIPPRFKHIFWSLVLVGLPAVLIAMQPDLGTALLIGVSGIFVLLLAGISWKLVGSAIGAGGLVHSCNVDFLFKGLPATTNFDLSESRKRPTGCWLEYYSIKNSNRLRRTLWQRLVERCAISSGFFT